MSNFLIQNFMLFGIKLSLTCSFSNLFDKTTLQVFCECDGVDIFRYFPNSLILPTSTPEIFEIHRLLFFGILD